MKYDFSEDHAKEKVRLTAKIAALEVKVAAMDEETKRQEYGTVKMLKDLKWFFSEFHS